MAFGPDQDRATPATHAAGRSSEGACNARDNPLDFRTVRTYIGHVERHRTIGARTFEEDK